MSSSTAVFADGGTASSRFAPISDELATSPDSAAEIVNSPLRFGVGARFTLSVMSDDYVQHILGALREVTAEELRIETGDVSTWIGGHERDILAYLTALTHRIAQSGEHASLSIHLSRGCPGEAACTLPGGAGPRAIEVPQGTRTGDWIAAEWALYPLGTPMGSGDANDSEHMTRIYQAIERTKAHGTFRASEHFVTRLEGDAGQILEDVVAGWVLTGQVVQHVTSHVTLSINSPSHTSQEGAK